VFGLQPTIRSDIAKWSPEHHKTFNYFADKKNTEYKVGAMDVLDILLNKTDHMSYFGKCIFGSKQYIRQFNNPTLYLVVLTWLRQLQQGFFSYNDHQDNKDWNKYGRHYGTNSKVSGNVPTLSNINMSKVRTEKSNLVTDLSFFKPNDVRTDVVTSFEEWAARILKPNFPQSLAEAKKDKDTSARFERARKPSQFKLTGNNWKTTTNDESDNQPTISTSPDKYKHEPKEQLLLNVTTGLKTILMSATKKKANTKKKLKCGEVSELQHVSDTVSSLVAYVNRTSSIKFHSLDDMHDILQQEAKIATEAKNSTWSTKVIGDYKSDSDSSKNYSSSDNNQTPEAGKVVKKRGIADLKYDDDSDDSDSSSDENKKPKAKKG
jgi:hypothetical protein